MGMIESLKRPLKKSYAIHSAYKLARDFGQIPKSKLTRFDALQDIAKILLKTMSRMPRLFDLFDLVKQINEDMTPGALVERGVSNGGAVGLMGLANRRFPGQFCSTRSKGCRHQPKTTRTSIRDISRRLRAKGANV